MKKGEEEIRPRRFSCAILFGAFLLIGIVFFVSLSVVKSGETGSTGTGRVALSPDNQDFNFGFGEIVFALSFAFVMTWLLVWVKSITRKNPYLGLFIGIISLVILGYGFSLRYRGFYSTIFMIVTGLLIMGYVGVNFFKYSKEG